MPTRDKELSSKGRAKGEASAPVDKRPMARFKFAAAKAMAVDPAKVRALEEKEKRARARKKSD